MAPIILGRADTQGVTSTDARVPYPQVKLSSCRRLLGTRTFLRGRVQSCQACHSIRPRVNATLKIRTMKVDLETGVSIEGCENSYELLGLKTRLAPAGSVSLCQFAVPNFMFS